MWLILAFASAFFAGITSILAKCGIKHVDSNLATAIRTIVILLFAALMYRITLSSYSSQDALIHYIEDVPVSSMCFLILSGITTGASWLCYFRALQTGDINKVTPIDKLSTVLTILLSFLLLKEPISYGKIAGIPAIGIGTYLMIEKRQQSEPVQTKRIWLVYALLSAIFASLTSILAKIGFTNIDSNLGTVIRTFVVLLMAWLIVLFQKKLPQIRHIPRRSWLFILLSGISTGASWLCYFRALRDGSASVVVSIDKLSILVSIVFSYFIFHEKLGKKSMTGLALVIIGTMALLI